MSVTKFEVGKKYRGILNTSCVINCWGISPNGDYGCTYLTSEGRPGGSFSDAIITKDTVSHGYWQEYKEPRTIERWDVIWQNPDGGVYRSCNFPSEGEATSAIRSPLKVIEVIKFTWTEKV